MDEVETEIEEVVKEIKVVEARLSQSQLGLLQLPVEEITYLLKKEERLCTREEQLRKDKDWLRLKEDRPLKEAEQIREKELISLRNSDKRVHVINPWTAIFVIAVHLYGIPAAFHFSKCNFIVAGKYQAIGYWDAFYFYVTAITTIGYGDIVPAWTEDWNGCLFGIFMLSQCFLMYPLSAALLLRLSEYVLSFDWLHYRPYCCK